MINAHKLSLAINAFSERFGKLKLSQYDTFIIDIRYSKIQVICNPGKLKLQFLNQGKLNVCNNALILLPCNNGTVNEVIYLKEVTNLVNGQYTIVEDPISNALNFISSREIKDFTNQFKSTDLASHPSFMFSYYVDPVIASKIKIINQFNNVYFVHPQNEDITIARALTKSFYDDTRNLIFTNLHIDNFEVVKNLESSLNKVVISQSKKSILIEEIDLNLQNTLSHFNKCDLSKLTEHDLRYINSLFDSAITKLKLGI